MQALIAKMRADWPVVAEDRRQCGDWTEADESEIGSAIAQAISKNDPDLIALWARWLADLSAISLGLKVIAVSKKMRDQARQQREAVGA